MLQSQQPSSPRQGWPEPRGGRDHCIGEQGKTKALGRPWLVAGQRARKKRVLGLSFLEGRRQWCGGSPWQFWCLAYESGYGTEMGHETGGRTAVNSAEQEKGAQMGAYEISGRMCGMQQAGMAAAALRWSGARLACVARLPPGRRSASRGRQQRAGVQPGGPPGAPDLRQAQHGLRGAFQPGNVGQRHGCRGGGGARAAGRLAGRVVQQGGWWLAARLVESRLLLECGLDRASAPLQNIPTASATRAQQLPQAQARPGGQHRQADAVGASSWAVT